MTVAASPGWRIEHPPTRASPPWYSSRAVQIFSDIPIIIDLCYDHKKSTTSDQFLSVVKTACMTSKFGSTMFHLKSLIMQPVKSVFFVSARGPVSWSSHLHDGKNLRVLRVTTSPAYWAEGDSLAFARPPLRRVLFWWKVRSGPVDVVDGSQCKFLIVYIIYIYIYIMCHNMP